MTKTIKLIVVDLDGTLLDSQSQMSERNEKALKAAIEKGVEVILATGKTRSSATEIIQRLNLTSPGIYLQGLAIYNGDGTLRYQQTLDPAIARQVITFAEDRGFVMMAYSGLRLMARAPIPFAYEFAHYREPIAEAVGPLQNLLDELPINKLVAFGDPHRIKALRWQLNVQHNGAIRLMQANVPGMLEILPPGTSKGAALRVLLKAMDTDAQEVLAIGDAENDVEMLQLAGTGVAVGNAEQKAKEAADHVVAANDQDGVAEAVERFVLGTEPAAASAAAASAEKPAEAVIARQPAEGKSE